jgi:hypothetical protein
VKKRSCHEIFAAVVAHLMTAPHSRAELLRLVKANPGSIYPLIEEMHDKCLVYVSEWRWSTRGYIPVYFWQPSVGEIEDKPMPERFSRARVKEQKIARPAP